MDVLTLNLALQKLQVNKPTKDGQLGQLSQLGQLPLPAANYKYISEMTGWMSSGRQCVMLPPDDSMEEKPAILIDDDDGGGDRSLSSGHICSAVANNLTSSSSSSSSPSSSSSVSSIDIPSQSHSLVSSSRNSDGTEPQTHLSGDDFSIWEKGAIESAQNPTNGVLLSPAMTDEELFGVDLHHQLGARSRATSGTSDDEVCDFMTDVRPSSPFDSSSVDFTDFSAAPVEEAGWCRLEPPPPRSIQSSRTSGFAPAKKRSHPISMSSSSCDSADVIARPKLDFDKMRKTSYGRRHGSRGNDIKKPKIIRIRSFRAQVHCTLQSQFSPSMAVAEFGLLSRKAGFMPVISVESLS